MKPTPNEIVYMSNDRASFWYRFCAREGDYVKSPYVIRFDWAIKRLLRNKANFEVLNGFLTCLLNKPIQIKHFLESESNAVSAADSINRVDVLVEDDVGALYIIEVQTTNEVDFFHRMMFGVSKLVSEYLEKGEQYGKIDKVYSVNIVYFELGQGDDYVYHGVTEFKGLYQKDVLQLSKSQREKFKLEKVANIFPEYFVLRVNQFNDYAKNSLDQWIYLLKNNVILEDFNAPGLDKAREVLAYDSMTRTEKRSYDTYLKDINYEIGAFQHWQSEGYYAGRDEGLAEGLAKGLTKGRAEGLAKGRAETLYEVAVALKNNGIPIKAIQQATGLCEKEIEKL